MAKFYQGPAPQQAEFDALNAQVNTLNSNLTSKVDKTNFITGNLGGGASKAFTIANNSRAIVFTIGAADGRNGIYGVGANWAGVVNPEPMFTASDVTISSSGNNNFTVTSTTECSYLIIVLSGSVT